MSTHHGFWTWPGGLARAGAWVVSADAEAPVQALSEDWRSSEVSGTDEAGTHRAVCILSRPLSRVSLGKGRCWTALHVGFLIYKVEQTMPIVLHIPRG